MVFGIFVAVVIALRRQLNRGGQGGEQSQSDDSRLCLGIHVLLLVAFDGRETAVSSAHSPWAPADLPHAVTTFVIASIRAPCRTRI